MGGSATEKERAYADTAIVKALRGRGFIADVLSVLLGGNVAIDVQPDREINQWATAKLELSGYDCSAGRALNDHSAVTEAFNWNWAVDQAVAIALRTYFFTASAANDGSTKSAIGGNAGIIPNPT